MAEFYTCPVCGWPYRSELAAEACCDEEYEAD